MSKFNFEYEPLSFDIAKKLDSPGFKNHVKITLKNDSDNSAEKILHDGRKIFAIC
jgi:hypothetical protein